MPLKGVTRLPPDVTEELDEIQQSIEAEKRNNSEAWVNFAVNPQTRKKLLTACALQSFQQLTGINSIMYYAPNIFIALGFTNGALMAQVRAQPICLSLRGLLHKTYES